MFLVSIHPRGYKNAHRGKFGRSGNVCTFVPPLDGSTKRTWCENMNVTKIIIGILIVFIGWDFLTTFYGTVSVFRGTGDLSHVFFSTPLEVYIPSIIFSVGLITFILSYRHILRADNVITKGLLFVAFVYDLGTSIYGNFSLISSGATGTGLAQWAIILLLAGMCTASPLLINQVLE